MEFCFPYGKQQLTLQLEEQHIQGVLLSQIHHYKAAKGPAELVEDALKHPVGTLPPFPACRGKEKYCCYCQRPYPPGSQQGDYSGHAAGNAEGKS